jgi:hypothetical protein
MMWLNGAWRSENRRLSGGPGAGGPTANLGGGPTANLGGGPTANLGGGPTANLGGRAPRRTWAGLGVTSG